MEPQESNLGKAPPHEEIVHKMMGANPPLDLLWRLDRIDQLVMRAADSKDRTPARLRSRQVIAMVIEAWERESLKKEMAAYERQQDRPWDLDEEPYG